MKSTGFSRRNLLRASAGMAALPSFAEAAEPAGAMRGVNRRSAPSALKITDMRACTIAANYDYPIIRIDTNQGVYGLGEVRDAGVKGIALILKAHLLGKDPLQIDTVLGSIRPFAYLAPSEAVGQLGRVLDLLARLSSVPSAEFDALLIAMVRFLRPGTTILVLSGRAPTHDLPALRRLVRSGFPILVVACGPDATRHAALARQAGLPARAAELAGPWQTSRELILAG